MFYSRLQKEAASILTQPHNKVKSKPYKDICIFLVAHKLKWKGIEPEVHTPYTPISYFV